jgi:hypothetical protein
MTDKQEPKEVEQETDPRNETSEERERESRRAFLLGLGKWSRAVIVGAVAGGVLLTDRPAQAGWINRRGGGGGGWINGGGGGSWVNRRGGGWGGSWINRR